VWHLYHVAEDFNELNDLAAKYPDKLKELQDAFDAEAWKYNVYPLKDQWETVNRSILDGKKQVTLYTAGRQYAELPGYRFNTGSYNVIADAEIPAKGAEGVLFSSGTSASGVSLYIRNKTLVFAYNAEGKLFEVTSGKTVPAGTLRAKVSVDYSGENGSDKAITLYLNDEKVGYKEISNISNAGGNLIQAGRNFGTPVSTAYKSPYTFTGVLKKVTVETVN